MLPPFRPLHPSPPPPPSPRFTPSPLYHPTSSTVKVAGPDRVCTLRTYNILEHFPTDNIAPEASDVEVKVAGVAPTRFECDTSGAAALDG